MEQYPIFIIGAIIVIAIIHNVFFDKEKTDNESDEYRNYNDNDNSIFFAGL